MEILKVEAGEGNLLLNVKIYTGRVGQLHIMKKILVIWAIILSFLKNGVACGIVKTGDKKHYTIHDFDSFFYNNDYFAHGDLTKIYQ